MSMQTFVTFCINNIIPFLRYGGNCFVRVTHICMFDEYVNIKCMYFCYIITSQLLYV